MSELHEVLVIGGGPAGLTAGLYLCRADIDALLLEEQLPGGQILNSPLVENYPGFPEGIAGIDLMQIIDGQAKKFGLASRTFAAVEKLVLNEDGTKTVVIDNGEEVRGRAVIVATGRRPATLGIPGESEYVGRGISYCATCDAPLFKDRDVLVVGGGDAALGEALHLAKFAGKVTLVHRRGELRAAAHTQAKAKEAGNLEILYNTEVRRIIGENAVTAAQLENNQTGESMDLPVAGVFFYIGNVPNTAFLEGVVRLDEVGYVVTDGELQANVPGIFAAGDVRANHFKQVVIAAGEGALAAMSAQRYLENIGARKAYEGGS